MHNPPTRIKMMKISKPSVFTQLNQANDYRSWKKKDATPEKKTMNPASVAEFPDLVKPTQKKTVFEGVSLANRLKEAIAAEEEAAIQKRLKKGETPETIFREMCVSLPLKGNGSRPTETFEVPAWVTEEFNPVILPRFKPKSMTQLSEERRWKRLGVNPNDLYVYDNPTEDEDDKVSVPSMPETFETFANEDAEEDLTME
jgi:hypothetical protein